MGALRVSSDSCTNASLVFEGPYRSFGRGRPQPFDISPDGQQFLMIKEEAEASSAEAEIVVVLNWHQELLERVPIP